MHARKMLDDLCTSIPKVFIIIDGLDECEQVERKQALDTLMGIATRCDQEDPGKLRLLIVSQEFADIRRVLHSSSISRLAPRTIQLTDAHNASDINTYVRIWVDRISNDTATLTDDLKEYLRNLTVCNAKGQI
jgi:hypothetical protein